jgi:hypothetical protein
MAKGPNHIGQRFGRLLVVARVESDKNGNSRWLCKCDCGNESTPLGQSLRSGATTSCGCAAIEKASAAAKHGASGTREYKAWHAMVQRCTNPKHHKWHRYGGRGITVCARWLSYEAFLEDMGPRPPGMTIDRRENDGHYEPGNCRWATPMQQANNREITTFVNVGGEVMSTTEASSRLGPNRSTVGRRIRDGWNPDNAASAPLNSRREK